MIEPATREAGAGVANVVGPHRREVILRGAFLASILVASIVPRLASLPSVFSRGELMQWDGDSAYHLKRIIYALANFPQLPRFDPEMNWPAGAPCPWPDGFDLLAAGWGLLAGLGDPARGTMAVLLFTTVIALFVIWAAMDLARLVLPRGPALEGAVASAGLLAAMVPSSIYGSQVGFLDHHVAELLAFLLLAGWALRRHPAPDPSDVRCGLRWELGGGLATTFALWVFAGGILYVALGVAIVGVALLRDERPSIVGSGLPALALGAATAALLNLPAVGAHGRLLTYQFPSLLQPLLVACGALALGLAVAATRLARGTARRAALLAACVLLLAAFAALLSPPLLQQVRAGLEGWLLRRDPWIAAVAEFQPFGWDQQTFLVALFHAFGAVGVLAPLLLAAGGWAIVRSTGARGVAFTVLSAAFVLFTLRQVRFERIGQPLIMIHAAAAFALLAQRKASGHLATVRAYPLVATLALIAADPTLRGALTPNWVRVPAAVSAALALRDTAGAAGREGALTSWDQGHLVSVLSGVPTPTNGFGSYLDPDTFSRTEAVLTSNGVTLDAFLQERRLRFVIAGVLTGTLVSVNRHPPFTQLARNMGSVLNPDYLRSFDLSPLVIGGSAVPGTGVRHIERLMPVFATREKVAGIVFDLPALWLYERVPGARLVGKAPPGARVLASLAFREQGRPHVWRAFADADSRGEYQLVIPFPTGLVRPAFSSGARFSLQADGGPPVEAEVPEQAVREGRTVRVGSLRRAAPAIGQPAAAGSLSLKTAPPPALLKTEISPPKDSTMP